MILENRTTEELDEYIEFAAEVGLPVTLADVKVKDLSEEGLRKTAELTVHEDETIHWMPFPATAEMVAGAIVGADAYARAYLEENGYRDRTSEPESALSNQKSNIETAYSMTEG